MGNDNNKKIVFWLVIGAVFIGCFLLFTNDKDSNKKTTNAESSKTPSKKIPKGYTKIPYTYFKTKEEVQDEFEKAGLKVEFFVEDLDHAADVNEKPIYKDMCGQINEQKNRKYFSSDEYGDNSGFYAKDGSTIKVGYSDHTYNPKDKNKSSKKSQSSKKESKTTNAKSNDHSSSKKSSSKSDKLTDAQIVDLSNTALQKDYMQALGWATGRLDRNGDPYPDGQTGEPIDSFKWAIYVKKIEASKLDQGVKIYLSSDGMQLSTADGYKVAENAQAAATAALYSKIGKNEAQHNQVNDFFYMKGDSPHVTAILCSDSGEELARTHVFNNNKFKQKDFQ